MRGSNLLYAALSVALIWFIARRAQAAIAPSQIAQNALPRPTPATTVQPSTLAFIRTREGLRLNAYPDGNGYSIGYGHFLGPAPAPATISASEAENYLLQDANAAGITIARTVRVPLNQNQYDALVSFVYNVGADAFASSTLLGRLNAGDYTGAASEFGRWVYSKGVVLPGLLTRRTVERTLFLA